jgi:uncharacterized protein YjiS (DUF1127 family)
VTSEDISRPRLEPFLGEAALVSSTKKPKRHIISDLIGRLQSTIRMWMTRHRDRQALLNVLDEDHRIAADLGTTEEKLRTWAQKPFWSP